MTVSIYASSISHLGFHSQIPHSSTAFRIFKRRLSSAFITFFHRIFSRILFFLLKFPFNVSNFRLLNFIFYDISNSANAYEFLFLFDYWKGIANFVLFFQHTFEPKTFSKRILSMDVLDQNALINRIAAIFFLHFVCPNFASASKSSSIPPFL